MWGYKYITLKILFNKQKVLLFETWFNTKEAIQQYFLDTTIKNLKTEQSVTVRKLQYFTASTLNIQTS